ncbi:hypothetical protein JOC85_002849 [Bacillus mesophilus]|uniref:Uncharacterized protein n=1 Tax=Bacillus mesophilus TaxID=1808955 RepID=A0A6M0Q8J7_9BACI|nr:hypothetical protein [Bacillus mesophilus]MBM7662042.1 hypothetical protein [Bacillus mesophilus]NEY72603.1 hypothetical protein [Bacillus mesophilus]
MESFKINHMIIDDEFLGEESVTADFTYNQNQYSVTFKKEDLELINSWYFEENQTIPANLSDTLIESLREEIKNRI